MKANKSKLDIAMANARMTPCDVSKKAGVAYQSIRRACINNGVKPATLGKIAAALNCDVRDILEDCKRG